MTSRLTSGIPGLDPVLGGGLFPGSCTLVTGAAGTGKTTLGLQFLAAGAAADEGGVYLTFEEFPEQVYRDAGSFGFDLPGLEKAGKLQVVCVAPDILLQEGTSAGGLIDELHAEVGMRRVVVDSLNLLNLGTTDQAVRRKNFYLLRNALRRFGVTSLFLHEQGGGAPGEEPDEFVADSVVRLTYDEMEGHRIRHVEVTKHRGSNMYTGRHVFLFTPKGIRVLPALNRVPDLVNLEAVSTGFPVLDEWLGGGLILGTTCAVNVNSKSNYAHLLSNILRAHVDQGWGLINGRWGVSTLNDISWIMHMHGVDLMEMGRQGRWLAIDYYGRETPSEYDPYVLRYGPAEQNYAGLPQTLIDRLRKPDDPVKHWLVVIDLNTLVLDSGTESFAHTWGLLSAAARQGGHTIITAGNFEEVGPALSAFIQRTATYVLRNWFDGRYQFVQVQKAPFGRVSQPIIAEYTEERPFIRLWG